MKLVRLHITLLLSLLTAANCFSGEDIFQESIKAIEKESFNKAITGFESIITADSNNTGAYYNLGVAYLGNKNYGKAIWAFEKVLNRIPNDSETTEHLEYTYEQLDNNLLYEPRLNSFAAGLYSISSNKWSMIAIISSLFLASCIFIFKSNSAHSTKRMMMIFGFVFSFTLISSVILASSTKQYQTEKNYGIVTDKEISTYTESQEELAEKLVEGERVQLVEPEKNGFIKVFKANRETVLVSTEDIAFI
ncbi:MAG: tetratricopeptide repeat protein [Crocinitomicaceae bacterium]